MATLIADMEPVLSREINVPGFEQLPNITSTQLDGYIADGFWEARLAGLLSDYTQTDGTELVPPAAGAVIKATADDGDLPEQYQILVAMFAALKMIRLKVLNLAVNLRATAGPVEYEQQASATTLRAILDSMERRVAQLIETYSDNFGSAFIYFDGVLQREYSMLEDVASLQVL